MQKNIIVLLFIAPLIFLTSKNKINYEYRKAEKPSTFSIFIAQNDSTYIREYTKASNLFIKKEYSEALKIALAVAEDSKNNNTKAISNFLIGEIFKEINNHNKAILYFKKSLFNIRSTDAFKEKSLSIRKSSSEKKIADNLLELGTLFITISKIDSAIFYYDKLLRISSINSYTQLKKASAYGNLSGVYFYNKEIKNLEKAKKYAFKAIEIHKKYNKDRNLAADYGNLASVYMEEKRLLKAKDLYLKALKLIENDNKSEVVKYREVLYDNLGWTLYNLKDYIAYDYLEQSITIRDSLKDVDIHRITEELELKHNVDLATKDAQIAKNETSKAQRNTWFVGIIGVSIALLLLALTNYYKLRQGNLKLKLSKNELEQQKKLDRLKSESQIKILNAAIDGKESERKQIAETLHDNVSALLSSANLHLQASQKQFNGATPVEITKTQQIILEASQQIRDLSHTLVSSILLKFGLEYAIKDIVEKYSNSIISFKADIKGIQRYHQGFEIKTYNIIQELANNILKHSKASSATISLIEEQNNLIITIRDNGTGFDINGVSINEGIGINQINARIHMMKGEFNIRSRKGKGTKINIVIPIQFKEVINYV